MSLNRRRNLYAGLLLAVLAGVLVDHGGHFGAELTRTAVLGLALGAVLGLVREGGPAGRAISFGVGFLASWLGFALRAGMLPDIPMGRAIAAVVVVALVTIAATASGGRLPLWAGLLGAGTLAGAYETTFTATPTAFTSESMTAATTAILCAAIGFVASVVISEWSAADAELTSEPEHAFASTATPTTIRLDRTIQLPGQREVPAGDQPAATAPGQTDTRER